MSNERADLPLDVLRTQREHTVSFNERTGKASAPSHVEEPLQTSELRNRVEKPLTADATSRPGPASLAATGSQTNRVKIVEASTEPESELAPPTPAFIPVDTVPAFIAAAAAMSDDFISAQALTAAGEALAQVNLHADAKRAVPFDEHLLADAGTAEGEPSHTVPESVDVNRPAVAPPQDAVIYPPTGTPAAFLMRNASASAGAPEPQGAQPFHGRVAPVESITPPESAAAHPVDQPEQPTPPAATVQEGHSHATLHEPDPMAGFLKVSLSSAAITRLESEEARAQALRGQIEGLSARIENRRK
jgi:hypothetical protein